MTRLKSWIRRSVVVVGAVLIAAVGLGKPAQAGWWSYEYVGHHCSATQTSPIAGVYWQVCSDARRVSGTLDTISAEPLVLISNTTARDYYVQATTQLFSRGVLLDLDSCATVLLEARQKMTCFGNSNIMHVGDNQQAKGRIAIAGQWDGWVFGETWTFR